ncbi:hypothetical protein C5167_012249 [Papaver somniferum]|uniref:NAD(+) ADP-ribosyltransferase n=1 Tax=Papaver somniferum TaxID=3469 RepID=A0A4Y7IXL9_PAPSO|nr:hypothetical protein C5167_012249 [Papaver somniferum]
MSSSKKNHYKDKMMNRKNRGGGEKPEDPELPKYRDRAKEGREDQNPDYEASELGSFHAVAPPSVVDLRPEDAMKISIENSKYLGGIGLCGGEIYDAMLNQTNLSDNNKSDDGGDLMVFTRWGRVGVKGQNKLQGPFTSRDEAIQEFEESFYANTKYVCHPKLYTWLEMDYEETDSESVQRMIEIGYDAEKLPLGKLSKSTIFKADVVLAFIGWGVLMSLLLVVSSKFAKEEHVVTIRTATAKSVYQWIVKPQTTVKLNEMFLLGLNVPYSGSWNYNINGVKHNTNLTCGINLGSMVWWDTFYHDERV